MPQATGLESTVPALHMNFDHKKDITDVQQGTNKLEYKRMSAKDLMHCMEAVKVTSSSFKSSAASVRRNQDIFVGQCIFRAFEVTPCTPIQPSSQSAAVTKTACRSLWKLSTSKNNLSLRLVNRSILPRLNHRQNNVKARFPRARNYCKK